MSGRTTTAMLARITALAAAATILSSAAPATAPADGPPSAEFPVRLTWSGPPSVHPDTAFTYVATVINTGATGRPLVVHESAVNGGEANVSAIPGQGSCAAGGGYGWTCTLGTVAAGASVTVTFTSKATYAGPLRITLSVNDGVGATSETYPVNVISAGDPLETDVRLSISGPETIHDSELGRYTITAHNVDSVSAHGVVLRGYADHLVRASLDGVKCPIVPTLYIAADCAVGDLAPGASVTMTVEAVASGLDSEVRASITQDWNATTTTRGFERRWVLPILPREEPAVVQPGGAGGELALRVDHPDTGPVGSHLVFTETITNLGSSPSGPLTLTLISSFADIIEHDHAECTRGVQWTACTLPGLAAGASTKLTFRAYPFDLSGGPMEHAAFVASSGSEATARWAYEAVNPSLPAADLSIVPLGGSIGAAPGGTVSSVSTWTVTNNGPDRAFGVMVLDTVSPATTHLVEVSGCGTDWCKMDWLEPGASVTATLRTLGPDAAVRHAVRIYHSGPDPVPANNAAHTDLLPGGWFGLTVAKSGTGFGTVSGSGFDCGSDCWEPFVSGTAVVLTAVAGDGSVFAGWTGCDEPSGPSCTTTVDAAKTISANFTATRTFADVPPTNPFFDEIEQLYDLGITTGCGTNDVGTPIFCPTEPVPRQQMAAFLVRAKGLTQLTPATPSFVDVPASNPFFGYIERLKQQGITTGCNPPTNNRFCPTEFVPRQQMAAFLIRAKGLTQLTPATPSFIDVPASNPFYGYIERLKQQAITTGCNPPANNLYCPVDNVPRQQMAAFLVRAFSTPGP